MNLFCLFENTFQIFFSTHQNNSTNNSIYVFQHIPHYACLAVKLISAFMTLTWSFFETILVISDSRFATDFRLDNGCWVTRKRCQTKSRPQSNSFYFINTNNSHLRLQILLSSDRNCILFWRIYTLFRAVPSCRVCILLNILQMICTFFWQKHSFW